MTGMLHASYLLLLLVLGALLAVVAVRERSR